MSILTIIAQKQYNVTGAQVESLARSVAQGEQADGTYLKVLVVAVQRTIGTGRGRLARAAQLKAVGLAHSRFYPHVQKGVGGTNVRERNRRGTFARTAASALRSFVQGGGDIRKLVANDVRKAKLLAVGQPVPTGTRTERAFKRSGEIVLRTALRLAEADSKRARANIGRFMLELQRIMDRLDTIKPAERKRTVMAAAASMTH